MPSVSGFGFATSAQALQRPRNGHTGQPDRLDQASNMALQAMGVDSSKAGSITKQIEAALQAAAKNSDGSSDPRAAAQQAVSDILTKNGIDPQQFKTQVQAAMKERKEVLLRDARMLARVASYSETGEDQEDHAQQEDVFARRLAERAARKDE